MNQLRHILAAVDFTEPAQAAFDHALALSRAHGADLTVVHAVANDQRFRRHARARVQLIAKMRQGAQAAGVRFAVSVQQGDPAGVILVHARASRPDLLVMGTHQRTGLDRLRIGSVAEHVVVKVAQPVLIVPAGGRTGVIRPFTSITAALDFRAASDRAVEQAFAVARRTNGRVTAVHVVEESSAPGIPRFLYRYGILDYENLLTRDAWDRLQATVARHASAAVSIQPRVVSGHPPTEIARVAEEADADLIVVGVSRRGAVSRAVFGATAARVMRIARQPILAIPDLTSSAAALPAADAQRRLAA